MDWQGIFASIAQKKVAVVGDIICDYYISTLPGRISREAPVLILEYENEKLVPGGAANVALNCKTLGMEVSLLGWLGQDSQGENISEHLLKAGLNVGQIYFSKTSTITKTRILAGGQNQLIKQQVLRLDRGQALEANEEKQQLGRQLSAFLENILPELDAVIFSDYGYGTVQKKVILAATRHKRKKPLFIAGDSRFGLGLYKNFDILTPNEIEARNFSPGENIDEVGRKIMERLHCQALLITRGGLGAVLFRPRQAPLHIPASGFTPIADVSGAGDTMLASVTAGRLSGLNWRDAAAFAGLAAAVVVRKAGTATTFPHEIMAMGKKEAKGKDGTDDRAGDWYPGI